MAKNQKIKIAIIIAGLGMILITALGIYQIFVLRKAHSAFENYYAFRGCVQLLSKTADYGTCRIASGQVIKIVKFQNIWYLDGDGPGIW